MAEELKSYALVKADKKLGLLFGYGVICKTLDAKSGELVPYFDQGDVSQDEFSEHIPEDEMLKAATTFMAGSSRAIEEEHYGPAIDGNVVFAFPMTEEIAKALGITVPMTGLLIAVRPKDPAVLAKAENGELKGFSIFGKGRREVVAA